MNEEATAGPGDNEAPDANPQARIVVRDDLRRSRLTVFFRLFLALPHVIVLGVWSLIALLMAIINWFAILFSGRTVGGDLPVRYLRYFTHVDAYLNLAANPFPGFGGDADSYPIEIEVSEARRQSRWKTAFRLVLAFPALLLASAFGAAGAQAGGGNFRVSFGIIAAAALLGWFASLARARMPQGLRDLIVYGLGYAVQVAAYCLLVTDRYPDSDPLAPRYAQPPPDHPLQISTDDDLRRSRLTVFFRLLLWLPHMVWLILWGVAAAFATLANWLVTLFAGRPAGALHRFHRRLPSLLDAHDGVPVSGREPVPRLHRSGRQLSGGSPDRAASSAESMEDRLPADPRHPGFDRCGGAGERLRAGGAVRVVRRPDPRPDAAWAAQPGRVRVALPGSSRRVCLHPHGSLSVRRAFARAAPARSDPGATAGLTGPPRAARRVLVALGLAALAGAWLFAAIRLWRTSVPGDLSLPGLDPHRYFGDALLDRAASYEAFLRVDQLLATVATLVALGLFAAKGARFARESAAGRIGTGMLLGMLGLGFVWLAQFPFGLAALWWERKHDTSSQGYVEWAINNFLSAGGGFLFISLALLIVMALAGVWRRHWWLPAAPALVAIGVLFAFVQPYLIPDLDPLRDPRVAADARQLAAQEGVSGTPVRVQNTNDLGGGANAAAAGFGPSKRVILWDTLLERFRREEIRVVLAHEFAHLSRNHILKTFAWMALLGLPIAFLVALASRRRGGLFEPAAVPLAIFVVVSLLFVMSPLQRAFSQRLEAEADWVALEATHDPGAAKELFRRFTRVALVQPDPPEWAGLLIETHPSMLERIEMAEAWRARQPR